ncbi:MAG: protease complex subunit PrcB family protein [Chloroflexota bacterium]
MSPSGPRSVAFTEVATAQNSMHETGAAIVVGADVGRLVAGATAPGGRGLIGAVQGAQNTGGYGIRVDRIERDGDRLVVRATFASPGPGSLVTQVLTSPAHAVSIATADIGGLRTAVLVDGTGMERARSDIP